MPVQCLQAGPVSYEMVPELNEELEQKISNLSQLQVDVKPAVPNNSSYKIEKSPDSNFLLIGQFYQCDIPLYFYPKKRTAVLMPSASYDDRIELQIDPKSRLSRIEYSSVTARKPLSSGLRLLEAQERFTFAPRAAPEKLLFQLQFIPFSTEEISAQQGNTEDWAKSDAEKEKRALNVEFSTLLRKCNGLDSTLNDWITLFHFEMSSHEKAIGRIIRTKLNDLSFSECVSREHAFYASKLKPLFNLALERHPKSPELNLLYLKFITEHQLFSFEDTFCTWITFIAYCNKHPDHIVQEDNVLSLFLETCKGRITFSSFSTLFGLFSSLVKDMNAGLNGFLGPSLHVAVKNTFRKLFSFTRAFLVDYGFKRNFFYICLLYSLKLLLYPHFNFDQLMDLLDGDGETLALHSQIQWLLPVFPFKSDDSETVPWDYLCDAMMSKYTEVSLRDTLSHWLHIEKSCRLFTKDLLNISHKDDIFPLMLSSGILEFSCSSELAEEVVLEMFHLSGVSLCDSTCKDSGPSVQSFINYRVINTMEEFCDASRSIPLNSTYWDRLVSQNRLRERALFTHLRGLCSFELFCGVFRFYILDDPASGFQVDSKAISQIISFVGKLVMNFLRKKEFTNFIDWTLLLFRLLYKYLHVDLVQIEGLFQGLLSNLDHSIAPRFQILYKCFEVEVTCASISQLIETSFDLKLQLLLSSSIDFLYLFLSCKIQKAFYCDGINNPDFLQSVKNDLRLGFTEPGEATEIFDLASRALLFSTTCCESEIYSQYVVVSFLFLAFSSFEHYESYCGKLLGGGSGGGALSSRFPNSFLEKIVETQVLFITLFEKQGKPLDLLVYSSLLLSALSRFPSNLYLWRRFLILHTHRHPQYSFIGDIPLNMFINFYSDKCIRSALNRSGVVVLILLNLYLHSLQYPHVIPNSTLTKLLKNLLYLEDPPVLDIWKLFLLSRPSFIELQDAIMLALNALPTCKDLIFFLFYLLHRRNDACSDQLIVLLVRHVRETGISEWISIDELYYLFTGKELDKF